MALFLRSVETLSHSTKQGIMNALKEEEIVCRSHGCMSNQTAQSRLLGSHYPSRRQYITLPRTLCLSLPTAQEVLCRYGGGGPRSSRSRSSKNPPKVLAIPLPHPCTRLTFLIRMPSLALHIIISWRPILCSRNHLQVRSKPPPILLLTSPPAINLLSVGSL